MSKITIEFDSDSSLLELISKLSSKGVEAISTPATAPDPSKSEKVEISDKPAFEDLSEL